MAGVTYADDEHRRIAEFAGWKPDQKCSGRGDFWTVLNSCVVGVPPIIVSLPSLISKMQHVRCAHGMIAEHVISPPPLDDALAMACLRKLGELNVLIEMTHSGYAEYGENKWECMADSYFGVLCDDPRAAIFAAVLAYLKR